MQEDYGKQEYGIGQDGNIRGMVRYFRCDKDYNKIKRVLAMALMDYLDNNRPQGKMCLLNGECKNIDDAFELGDWDMIFRYIEKYIKKIVMAQYINKDAIVAEIKRLKSVFVNERDDFEKGYHHGLNLFTSSLDTIKVKELYLEDTKKEELAQTYVNYIFNRFDIDSESTEGELIYAAYMHGINECLTQLRAQKGE